MIYRKYYLDVALNKCFGGWKLSYNAIQWLKNRGATQQDFINWSKYKDRSNNLLISCINTLGKEASSITTCGPESCLIVKTLSSDYPNFTYFIQDWDGIEQLYIPNNMPWTYAYYSRVHEWES